MFLRQSGERAQREKEAEIIVRELKVEDSAAVAEMEQQIFRIVE